MAAVAAAVEVVAEEEPVDVVGMAEAVATSSVVSVVMAIVANL